MTFLKYGFWRALDEICTRGVLKTPRRALEAHLPVHQGKTLGITLLLVPDHTTTPPRYTTTPPYHHPARLHASQCTRTLLPTVAMGECGTVFSGTITNGLMRSVRTVRIELLMTFIDKSAQELIKPSLSALTKAILTVLTDLTKRSTGFNRFNQEIYRF